MNTKGQVITELRQEMFELKKELHEIRCSAGDAWDMIADLAVTFENRPQAEIELTVKNIVTNYRLRHPKGD